MIAELAAALIDDAPCPVCGALEHPDPSEVRGRQVSKSDETAAALASDEAQDHARVIGERLAAVQTAAEGARERLRELERDGAEAVSLRAERTQCSAQVERLTAEAAGLAAAEAELAEAELELTERRAELVRVEAECGTRSDRRRARRRAAPSWRAGCSSC